MPTEKDYARYERNLKAGKPLSPQERKYVYEYIQCWSGLEATRRAGYKSVARMAHVLMNDPRVLKAIEDELDKMAIGVKEILARVSAQARASIGDYITIDDETGEFKFDLRQAKADDKLGLIRKLKQHPSGGIELELYDVQAALKLAGLEKGMFTENRVITFKVAQELEGMLDKLERQLEPEVYARVLAIIANDSSEATEEQISD